MGLEEAVFWIFLTIFGTGLYLVFDHPVPGAIITGVGIFGLIYSLRHHLDLAQYKIWIVIVTMVVTSVALGYDIYLRIRNQPASQQKAEERKFPDVASALPLLWKAQDLLYLALSDNQYILVTAPPENQGFGIYLRGVITAAETNLDKEDPNKMRTSKSPLINPEEDLNVLNAILPAPRQNGIMVHGDERVAQMMIELIRRIDKCAAVKKASDEHDALDALSKRYGRSIMWVEIGTGPLWSNEIACRIS